MATGGETDAVSQTASAPAPLFLLTNNQLVQIDQPVQGGQPAQTVQPAQAGQSVQTVQPVQAGQPVQICQRSMPSQSLPVSMATAQTGSIPITTQCNVNHGSLVPGPTVAIGNNIVDSAVPPPTIGKKTPTNKVVVVGQEPSRGPSPVPVSKKSQRTTSLSKKQNEQMDTSNKQSEQTDMLVSSLMAKKIMELASTASPEMSEKLMEVLEIAGSANAKESQKVKQNIKRSPKAKEVLDKVESEDILMEPSNHQTSSETFAFSTHENNLSFNDGNIMSECETLSQYPSEQTNQIPCFNVKSVNEIHENLITSGSVIINNTAIKSCPFLKSLNKEDPSTMNGRIPMQRIVISKMAEKSKFHLVNSSLMGRPGQSISNMTEGISLLNVSVSMDEDLKIKTEDNSDNGSELQAVQTATENEVTLPVAHVPLPNSTIPVPLVNTTVKSEDIDHPQSAQSMDNTPYIPSYTTSPLILPVQSNAAPVTVNKPVPLAPASNHGGQGTTVSTPGGSEIVPKIEVRGTHYKASQVGTLLVDEKGNLLSYVPPIEKLTTGQDAMFVNPSTKGPKRKKKYKKRKKFFGDETIREVLKRRKLMKERQMAAEGRSKKQDGLEKKETDFGLKKGRWGWRKR